MLARARCQMAKPRRSFSPGFKREAADLVLKQNYSLIEASRSIGVELRGRAPVAMVGTPIALSLEVPLGTWLGFMGRRMALD